MTTLEAPPLLVNGRRACVHCRSRVGSQRRGLCNPCYCDATIRLQYPPTPTTRFGVCSSRDSNRESPPPRTPTRAIPGTEAKVLVLIARAEAGESLWHKDDAGMGDDGRAT